MNNFLFDCCLHHTKTESFHMIALVSPWCPFRSQVFFHISNNSVYGLSNHFAHHVVLAIVRSGTTSCAPGLLGKKAIQGKPRGVYVSSQPYASYCLNINTHRLHPFPPKCKDDAWLSRWAPYASENLGVKSGKCRACLPHSTIWRCFSTCIHTLAANREPAKGCTSLCSRFKNSWPECFIGVLLFCFSMITSFPSDSEWGSFWTISSSGRRTLCLMIFFKICRELVTSSREMKSMHCSNLTPSFLFCQKGTPLCNGYILATCR